MREFFNERRRKIGVVTLVLACVVMAGWMRSSFVQDQFTFQLFWWLPHVELVSAFNHVILATLDIETNGVPTWMSEKATVKKWRLNYCGTSATTPISDQAFSVGGEVFGIGVGTSTVSAIWCEFPYWSIVLPLTLLST